MKATRPASLGSCRVCNTQTKLKLTDLPRICEVGGAASICDLTIALFSPVLNKLETNINIDQNNVTKPLFSFLYRHAYINYSDLLYTSTLRVKVVRSFKKKKAKGRNPSSY